MGMGVTGTEFGNVACKMKVNKIIEVYIYLCLYTTNFTILSNCKVNGRVVTCFGRSCSHLQASLKTEQVPWFAHNMGSHMFTCVCTCKVEEHQLKSFM
jgi:hypothetical protein